MDLFNMNLLPGDALPFVLDVLVKGSLVLAGAGLLTSLLRKMSASSRHLVWTIALTGVLALPALVALLPAWQIPVLPPETPALETTVPAPAVPTESGDVQPPLIVIDGSTAQELIILQQPTKEAAIAPIVDKPIPWPVWLMMIWAAGSFFILSRWLVGLACVQWMKRRSRLLTDPTWRDLTDVLLAQLSITRDVDLRQSSWAIMPMTWGMLRPVVLLPTEADTWPMERRRAVLLHELAHVKRLDSLTQILVQFACALYWFNPLVWIASRHVQLERELACDDYVLQIESNPTEYAGHILDVASSFRAIRSSALATIAMARKSQLEGRLLAILDTRRNRNNTNSRTSILAVLSTFVLMLPLAAMRPTAAPVQEQSVETANSQRNTEVSVDVSNDVKTEVALTPLVEVPVTVTANSVELAEATGLVTTSSFSTMSASITPLAAASASIGMDLNLRVATTAPADTNWTLDDLLRLRQAGVTPEYIAEMRSLGFNDLSVTELIQLGHSGVNAEYMAEMREAGFADLSIKEVIQLRHASINADFLAEIRNAGFSDFSLQELIQFRHSGVDARYMSQMRDAGFNNLGIKELIQLRHAGISVDYITEMQDAGVENLTIQKLIRYRNAGMDAEYIREMKKALEN